MIHPFQIRTPPPPTSPPPPTLVPQPNPPMMFLFLRVTHALYVWILHLPGPPTDEVDVFCSSRPLIERSRRWMSSICKRDGPAEEASWIPLTSTIKAKYLSSWPCGHQGLAIAHVHLKSPYGFGFFLVVGVGVVVVALLVNRSLWWAFSGEVSYLKPQGKVKPQRSQG